jgi:hemin uptake protein HemP
VAIFKMPPTLSMKTSGFPGNESLPDESGTHFRIGICSMNPEETNLDSPEGSKAAASESRPSTGGKQRELTSEELLAGQQEICIRHGEEIYRLRLTRNGKLILHK